MLFSWLSGQLALREGPESERFDLLLELGYPGLIPLNDFLHVLDGLLSRSLRLCLLQALLQQLYAPQRFFQSCSLLVRLETVTAPDERLWQDCLWQSLLLRRDILILEVRNMRRLVLLLSQVFRLRWR